MYTFTLQERTFLYQLIINNLQTITNKNDVSKRETEQLQTEYSKKQSLLSDFIGYIDKITTFARK
jgi:hypothetical protein